MKFTININDVLIDWRYTDEMQEKQYHLTWIPKRKDIQILSKDLHGLTLGQIKDAIFEELARDIRSVKDRINKKARARRRNENIYS
jgi:hypothetical protein